MALLGFKGLKWKVTLQWRHNDHDGVSNHQPHGCLINRLFRRRSKKTSKLGVTGLCAGNSPVTGEFHAQRACNAENVSIWLRLHGNVSGVHFYPGILYPDCVLLCFGVVWQWSIIPIFIRITSSANGQAYPSANYPHGTWVTKSMHQNHNKTPTKNKHENYMLITWDLQHMGLMWSRFSLKFTAEITTDIT